MLLLPYYPLYGTVLWCLCVVALLQTLAIHDCAYRMRPLAKWVLMQDMDEYLEVVPPATARKLLEAHEGRPWITTGCIVFSVLHCIGSIDPLTDTNTNTNSNGDGSARNGREGAETVGHGDKGNQGGKGDSNSANSSYVSSNRYFRSISRDANRFLLAPMQFRWPHIYCQAQKVDDSNFCTGQLGHRKYFVNPRKVCELPGAADASYRRPVTYCSYWSH